MTELQAEQARRRSRSRAPGQMQRSRYIGMS